ncbi:MAG: hypothetical protein QM652_06130 [Legionella sp.]|uniref:hypothetical protein n=1 Tax=Legionella sp. TaxID=459 RepID=UPI0039E4C97B
MKKLIICSIITLFTAHAFAENPINTQTKTWKSIPITVDTNTNTYTTAQGFLLPEGNYYYTYSGYRCLINKTEIPGVNPVVLKPQNATGTMIYCYPDN